MSNRQASILIVEDDKNLSFLLKNNLEQDGYKVICSPDGLDGWHTFNNHHFDLCILDVMLPKQDGFTLAEIIRKKSRVPLLMLTAKVLKEDVYKAFEVGADDYITKPFTAKELLFRIKAILRRTMNTNVEDANDKVPQLEVGTLNFNYNTRELQYRDGSIKLSTKENELLRILCENKNRVVNRSRLLQEVWGSDDFFVSKSLDVYITKLRKILAVDEGISIQNYHGVGYKIVVK